MTGEKKKTKRRWLQFSLSSLILLTVICAIALSFWRHWRMNAELTATKQQLQKTEAELQDQRQVNAIFRGIDLENPEHRKAFRSLQYLMHWCEMKRKTIVIDGASFEVIFFENSGFTIPGSEVSVAALIQDGEFLDVVFRSTSTRREFHDLTLEDVNDDGEMDVVFNCGPGMLSFSKPFKIAYEITTSGFKKIDK